MKSKNKVVVSNDNDLIFENGIKSKGKIILRYNIPQAKIEYYFIPSNRFTDYDKARSVQDLQAHKKYGVERKELHPLSGYQLA